MRIIYWVEPTIKRLALITVLEAAFQLNRFAAMSTFNDLLKSISDDADAFAIADGIRDHSKSYICLYDPISKKELHLAIQVVWDDCSRME